MSGLTELERRGARVLALLLALGTLSDLHRARHPERAAVPPSPYRVASGDSTGAASGSLTQKGVPATRSVVDLDLATVAELDRLPGIGPVLAARIVEHRERHGRFRRLEELLAVPGIGPRLFERLRPWLKEPVP